MNDATVSTDLAPWIESATDPGESTRALARLARFAGITGAATAGLLARAAARRSSIEHSARAGHEWALAVIGRLGLDLRVNGSPPPPGVLVTGNHRSYVDIPAILAATPAIFLAKVEVGAWPLLGWGARIAHTIFVCREDAASRKQALAQMRRVLDRGTSVALFPEGTTTKTPGMLPFHRGSFRLAAERGYGVVPAAIRYDDPEDAWIDDESFVAHFRRRCGRRDIRLTLDLGPVLHGSDPESLKTRAEDWILDRIGGPR